MNNIYIVFKKVSLGEPPTYRDPIASIVLARGMVRMTREEGIDWKSAKLEHLGSYTKGSSSTEILRWLLILLSVNPSPPPVAGMKLPTSDTKTIRQLLSGVPAS